MHSKPDRDTLVDTLTQTLTETPLHSVTSLRQRAELVWHSLTLADTRGHCMPAAS